MFIPVPAGRADGSHPTDCAQPGNELGGNAIRKALESQWCNVVEKDQHRMGDEIVSNTVLLADVLPGSLEVGAWPHTDRRRRPRPQIARKLVYWEVDAGGNRHRLYKVCKRAMDVVGASLLIILLSPILAITFIVLWVTTRGRPLFRQTRIGVCGRLFNLYKFRTMLLNAEQIKHQIHNEKDGPIFKNRRDPRITWFGGILRKFSIDELPQLFNVLRGDMSLVGPRPPVEPEVVRYEDWQLRRLSVKPGLTCLWQVSGRSEIGFVQWDRMDLWYVDRQSLLLDLVLLAKTPLSVLSGRGAY
jgi:lipopolysaccharide/colanic/teichoic acid biosynthesis glycosyltransferase